MIDTKINKNIKIIIGVVILLLLFWLMIDWGKDKIITSLGGYTKKETVIKVDTISVDVDTIVNLYKELLIKVEKLEKGKEIKNYYNTYVTVDSLTGERKTRTEIIPLVKTFTQAVTDSLIDGKIFTVLNPVSDEIVYQDFLYKPKFPSYITKTITVQRTVENTLTKDVRNKIGIGVNWYSNDAVGIKGIYQLKSNWQFEAGYNTNYSTSNSVDRSVKGKNKFVNVGIIKLF